ncbi:MAG: hypothetical protein KDK41_01000 [Leptospiraceae bacterium]|nr:hypothetical protein [Leptospiraceae bacterium]
MQIKKNHRDLQFRCFLQTAFICLISALLILPACSRSEKISRNGLQLLKQGKTLSALAEFEKALAINENDPLAQYGKGRILARNQVTRQIAEDLIRTALPELNEVDLQTGAYEVLLELRIKPVEDKRKIKDLLTEIENLRLQSPQFLLAKATLTNDRQTRLKIYNSARELYPQDIEIFQTLLKFTAVELKDHKAVKELLADKNLSTEENRQNYFTAVWLTGDKTKAIEFVNTVLQIPDLPEKEKNLWKKILEETKSGRFTPEYIF